MLFHGQARDFPHRPDFDRSDARSWNLSSDADRLVEIFGMDQEVAGDLLARLHERTVGHETFAVADPNNRAVDAGCSGEALRYFPSAWSWCVSWTDSSSISCRLVSLNLLKVSSSW